MRQRLAHAWARDRMYSNFSVRPSVYSPSFFTLSYLLSPRGAVHADLLAKHQRRVCVHRKPLSLAGLRSHPSIFLAISATSCSPFPCNLLLLEQASKCYVEYSLATFKRPTFRGVSLLMHPTHSPSPLRCISKAGKLFMVARSVRPKVFMEKLFSPRL